MNIIEQFGKQFEPELLKEMETYGVHHSAKRNDVLLDVGQTVTFMPIIVSGVLKVSRTDESGKEIFLYYVNPNEGCAMTFTCCMQEQQSEIKAVVEEDVEYFTVPVDVMDKWLIHYPSWKNFVMNTIQNRFSELIKTIDQIAFQKLDDRLIHYLKEKSNATGSSLINLSHEQIAHDLATSRVVISRLLKTLENDKRVVLYRNQIKLLSQL